MLKRKVTLYCPVCGNDQFSCIDTNISNYIDAPDSTIFQCSDCKNTITKAALIENNQHIINENIVQIKQQAIDSITAKIYKSLK